MRSRLLNMDLSNINIGVIMKFIKYLPLKYLFSGRKKMMKNVFSGIDERGTKYKTIEQMWKVQLQNAQHDGPVVDKVGDRTRWYNGANQYWTKSQATYNGVLGGFGNLSSPDIKFSLKFLIDMFRDNPQIKRESVLDCGAGIGRITKQLLSKIYKTVDITDQCEKYIQKAKTELVNVKNVRNYYVKGLQEFQYTEKYDCVWVQWVLAYLPDKQAIEFFNKSKLNLNENGIIIVKQNVCKNGFVVDKVDFSVTRSDQLYKKLFHQAKLTILKQQYQTQWPKDIFDVKMYALKI